MSIVVHEDHSIHSDESLRRAWQEYCEQVATCHCVSCLAECACVRV